ncbi:hypothetical protein G6011_07402 [Alternaria panax]|uniref:Uncharacterized protein n=1 Tax=Alternaria panax TaxID=48097 RepID=A0AAD4I7H5_9PLEO|nr:hypothetical protein G6011_07402 [Alternaria panax]
MSAITRPAAPCPGGTIATAAPSPDNPSALPTGCLRLSLQPELNTRRTDPPPELRCMAQVASNPRHYAQQNAPHGTKRAADTSLASEQRLSKRFDLLNLVDNNGTRLYIPVPGSTDAALPRTSQSPTSYGDPIAFVASRRKQPRRPRLAGAGEEEATGMQVEDTPHRVYISDLSAELSDIESDEDNPIFLSDIEKHLSRIPKHVLLGPEPKPTDKNQLVLYNVPASLTVPEAQDNVRKAIVEARQRIRDKQVNPVTEPVNVDLARNNYYSTTPTTGDDRIMDAIPQPTAPPADGDGDAMDID